MLDYLQNIREVVAAERDVMLRYLGRTDADAPCPGSATSAAHAGACRRPEHRVADPVVEPIEATRRRPRRRSSGAMTCWRSSCDLVADRTGYPTDMLDPDLDLEADLSHRLDQAHRDHRRAGRAPRAGTRWPTRASTKPWSRSWPSSSRSARSWPGSTSSTASDGRPTTTRRVAPDTDARPQAASSRRSWPSSSRPATTRYVVTTVDLDPPRAEERRLDGTADRHRRRPRGVWPRPWLPDSTRSARRSRSSRPTNRRTTPSPRLLASADGVDLAAGAASRRRRRPDRLRRPCRPSPGGSRRCSVRSRR